MAEQFQNFFVTKLREACDATATTIYVETVPSITEGTLVLEYANSTKHEIIHFTGVSGYGLTGCTRGLEGTTAQSHSAGTDVRQNLTAGMIDKLINGVITTENIADGAVTADKIDFTTLGNQSTYVDIGNIRIQFGTQTGGKYNSNTTVTLPAPFADTSYAVSAVNQFNETGASRWLLFLVNKTTSSFTYRSGFLVQSSSEFATNTSNRINWIAMGLKPSE